ncbi:DUF1778 domain-containing protein [Mesorhizobium sp. ES1-3]|uniref:type II toxin -antitoxin system TacA 1-like antitoxin n=1 Tax=Mesorhizobium sp. ES1-3 TaxID=2876628 RepID=UPI001CD03A2C|nr:DUF1778 domain-containing protein [Mesorhizobium sp. ES1-3]MBZ9673614.1 DUF1778 domain-containing protein [Mesorhizobium sp. ES1-3]
MMPNKQAAIARAQSALPSTGEAAVMGLSIEDQIALAEAILNPPEPNEALRAAANACKRLIVDSR